MSGLNDIQLVRLLVQLGLLIVASRLLGDLARRVGQAPVIGELLGGVILGPSLLGRVAPTVEAALFYSDPVVSKIVDGVAWLGVILLLVQIGLESDFDVLRQVGRRAGIVAGAGAAVSLASGFALGWMLPPSYRAIVQEHTLFALFVGVAIAISAVPVIAKVLLDLNLMRRNLGMLILGAGVIDDLGGWLLLSIVAALAERGTIDPHALTLTIVSAAVFIGFCVTAGFRITAAVLRWVNDNSILEHSTLTVIIVFGLLCAITTQMIGIHAVFGAFAAGLMLGRSARVRKIDVHEITAVASGFLAPIFFAYSGMRTDLFAIASPSVLALVFGIACAAKIIGSMIGGAFAGLPLRESLAAAVGLNARGGMGVVAALLGLKLHVLTPEMYSILIVVAILTSVISPPLLERLLRGVALEQDEIERFERDKLRERMQFMQAGARLLVLAGGGPNAELSARIAAAIGNHPEATITLFHVSTADATDNSNNEEFKVEFDRIASLIERNGGARVLRRVVRANAITEAVIAECQRGYDAIFAGASRAGATDSFGGDILTELIRAARVPVVIARAREEGASAPIEQILVPITGASYSRLALTMAIMCAQALNGSATALYVTERPSILAAALGGHDPRLAANILDDARALGSFLGYPLEARIIESTNVENSVLRAADTGGYDLIFLGVLARAVEGRAYFGPKVERIITRSRRAVAVAVMPEKPDLSSR